MHDGTRKVVAITEVQRMESDVITLQDLFRFHVDGVASDRKVVGQLSPTGLRPTFLEKFEKRGVELPEDIWGSAPLVRPQLIARGAQQ
jgi:pilus assembly protein CpaF